MKPMRTAVWLLVGALLLFVLAYLSGAFFIVPETHTAVVKRFGDVRRVIVTGFYEGVGEREGGQRSYVRNRYGGDTDPIEVSIGAGWYVKVPFIDDVVYFDARILDWDGERKEISTQDLRTLLVDSSARWRILDPVQFYRALGESQLHAQDRLDGVINSQIEDEISNTRLIEVVRNENLELGERVKQRLKTVEEEEAQSAQIRYGRKELISRIQTQAEKELRGRFGVQLVDLMITQLNYTESVRKQVYDRMISERERIAARYRAQGERSRREILGRVQRQKDELLSGAQRRVEEIMGRAEARSIDIRARVHRRDPAFYKFQRSLAAYRNGLDTDTIFVLSDDNELLDHVTSPRTP